jgi:hypothetical protein
VFDCGVYVCKYAYEMYQLREQAFTYADARNVSGPFYDFITNGNGFKCDMNDISRLREEIHILAKRLSVIYRRRNPTTFDEVGQDVSLVDSGGNGRFWGRNAATAKIKTRERLTAFPTPVPVYVMACYQDHYDKNCVASDDSEDAIRVRPGDAMKVMNVLLKVLDFLPGKIFYGTKLLDHVSLIGLDLADVEIQGPTGWVTITKQNWRRIVVKRSPATSRALIKDLMLRKNEKTTDLMVYGTEDDSNFRDIEALHYYPPPDESLFDGNVTSTSETLAICFICGGFLNPKRNWCEMDQNGFVMDCKAAPRRSSLQAHVQKRHPATPFAFLDDWKNAQDKEFVDMKAFCQEALYEAYVDLGLRPDLCEEIHKTRTDEGLKNQLSYLFVWAAAYVEYRLRSTWKRRTFVDHWMRDLKKKGSTNERSNAIIKLCEDEFVTTIRGWIKVMNEECRKFDFVAFLDFHKGNWRCMWNSMVYFFRRGLYFSEKYPPVPIAGLVNVDNRNIIVKLEEHELATARKPVEERVVVTGIV